MWSTSTLAHSDFCIIFKNTSQLCSQLSLGCILCVALGFGVTFYKITGEQAMFCRRWKSHVQRYIWSATGNSVWSTRYKTSLRDVKICDKIGLISLSGSSSLRWRVLVIYYITMPFETASDYLFETVDCFICCRRDPKYAYRYR